MDKDNNSPRRSPANRNELHLEGLEFEKCVCVFSGKLKLHPKIDEIEYDDMHEY